jgi:predicted ATP-grasp superfamily ATP-dependent carboligase
MCQCTRIAMPSETAPILVVAVTGRALAASAARAGRPVVVLDYFADRDTCALAVACRAVAFKHALRFDRRRLLAAAATLAPASHSAGLVYGSGFEGRISLLASLSAGRPLHGNPPAVVSTVRTPAQFFPLLDRLGISYPEVRYTAPSDPVCWLVKEPGGAGGTRVRFADRRRIPAKAYFQRLMPGRVCSVLFLADGRRAWVVGFNEQWTSAANARLPFLYGGAVGRIALPSIVEQDLRLRLDALVMASGLVGLNGLDFLLHDEAWSALEVNPRPTATIELYDPDYEHGLFEAHLAACRRELPRGAPNTSLARASTIVRAAHPWQVTESFTFPDWCRDLPQPGTSFAAGDPVCTAHAESDDARGAAVLVRQRQEIAERAFAEEAATAAAR